jgi:hypothetical protein
VTLRERVFLADADAVLLTRHGEGLVRALAKIDATADVPMKVAPAMAHLYFVDPLSQGVPRWDRVFATHPSVEDRIAALSAMAGGIPPSLVEAAAAVGERYRSESRLNIPADQAPPPEGQHGQAELAAAEDDRSLQLAFRLTADAPLYAAPDRASTRLAKLPEGTLVTASETDGDFFAVLTDDDSFGYIPRSAAMLRVDLESAS